jgi:hypothetical protein
VVVFTVAMGNKSTSYSGLPITVHGRDTRVEKEAKGQEGNKVLSCVSALNKVVLF